MASIPRNARGTLVWDECETCYCLLEVTETIRLGEEPILVQLQQTPGTEELRLTLSRAKAARHRTPRKRPAKTAK